jgi:hypothetical protein
LVNVDQYFLEELSGSAQQPRRFLGFQQRRAALRDEKD